MPGFASISTYTRFGFARLTAMLLLPTSPVGSPFASLAQLEPPSVLL